MGGTFALVLAAGRGKRMGSSVPKQFLLFAGRPLLYYSLETFQNLNEIDGIVVTADPQYKKTIDDFDLKKIKAVVPGGEERYSSVRLGLLSLRPFAPDYVLIHDGARPFPDAELILRTLEGARKYGAAAAAVPVADTIRVADENGFGIKTPDRRTLYAMQTPQTFSFPLILKAYEELMKHPDLLPVTDDAEVLQKVTGKKTFLTKGSFRNRKVTTPEDLAILKSFS